MRTYSIINWAKGKLSYALDVIFQLCFRCHIPAAVNVISMILIQQIFKLLILQAKAHSFHTANISCRHISLQPQFFIIRQTRALS